VRRAISTASRSIWPAQMAVYPQQRPHRGLPYEDGTLVTGIDCGRLVAVWDLNLRPRVMGVPNTGQILKNKAGAPSYRALTNSWELVTGVHGESVSVVNRQWPGRHPVPDLTTSRCIAYRPPVRESWAVMARIVLECTRSQISLQRPSGWTNVLALEDALRSGPSPHSSRGLPLAFWFPRHRRFSPSIS
jgi:hypothetical protein